MIIKSKIKTFGFGFSILAMIAGVIVFFCFPYFDNGTPIRGIIFLYFVLVLLIGIYGKLLWDSNKLVIDTEAKTITFKNRFTQKIVSLPFEYFDGYISSNQPIKFDYVRNIYLIKDKIFIKRMCSFCYSNIEELEKSLSPIENLGYFDFSYWKSIKILFGKSVLT